jgi:tRNA pseudouridine55 synthase
MNLPEIILIDKPYGISSYDCIRRLQKKFGREKMGHAGTLDPLATGLMIIGIKSGTKKLSQYIKLPKTYHVEILLGISTETCDMEGKKLCEVNIEKLDEEKVKKVIKDIVGKIHLPVPIYSAIKVGGEALYKKARRGEMVKTPKKEMEIISTNFISLKKFGEQYIIELSIFVSSGTYIRSLSLEIGRRLSLPAVVYSLRRTSIGDFDITSSTLLC